MVAALQAPAAAQVYEVTENGATVSSDIFPTSTQPKSAVTPPLHPRGEFPATITRKLMPSNWKVIVIGMADRHGIDPILFEALIWQESRWNPAARSPKGAVGLAQLMPGTAQQLGINPFDPVANLECGARYLKSMMQLFNGDVNLALAAYNAGPMRVSQYGGVPPFSETRNYVASIQQRVIWGGALED